MRLLKVLVIVMALPIVGGTVALVWLALHRAGMAPHPAETVAVSMAPSKGASGQGRGGAGYVTVDVPVPPGMHFEQMMPAGDRVLFRFSGDKGAQRVLMVDPDSGAVTGTITLDPGDH